MIPIIIYDSGTQSIIWIDPKNLPEWIKRYMEIGSVVHFWMPIDDLPEEQPKLL